MVPFALSLRSPVRPSMARSSRRPNWTAWLRSWDRQQESFNPTREQRFELMFDVLEAHLGTRFTAIDLGCGPGSLSARLLRRFPRAKVVAVDYDPVVRQIGEGALGDQGGRLMWVDAKLGATGWTKALPVRRVDAAVSTTALHWLTETDLGRLYRDLGRLVRRGGVFLNGDDLPSPPGSPMARLAREALDLRYSRKDRAAAWAAWKIWWRNARREPALRAAFREHRRRRASHPTRASSSLAFHEASLRLAGFRTVGTVFQIFENRVLYAER
jgi:SAM-dependent methyltransferase